jgi:hypothetical protein
VFHESALYQVTTSQVAEKLALAEYFQGFVSVRDFSRAERGQRSEGI